VKIFPGTDGLLHISESPSSASATSGTTLKLGDQVLVKVLAIEGNKIRCRAKRFFASSATNNRRKRQGDSADAALALVLVLYFKKRGGESSLSPLCLLA